MTNMIILKTRKKYLDAVVLNGKHATDRLPKKVAIGDIILIAQTISSLDPGQKQIAFAAEYNGSHRDQGGETSTLWGKGWCYVIDLQSVKALDHPFTLSEVQVSSKNYGRGAISFAYIEEDDEEVIKSHGHLKPFLTP